MSARALFAASWALFAPVAAEPAADPAADPVVAEPVPPAAATAVPVDGSSPQLLVVANGGPEVGFVVLGPDEPFAAGVLLSLQAELMHFYVGLPPLLADAVLLGTTFAGADEAAIFVLPAVLLPAGVPLYAQGLVLTDAGLAATDVAPLEVTARSR